MKEKDFDSWRAELTALAPKYGWENTDPVEECGAESWREYFENEYSPADALYEDSTCL